MPLERLQKIIANAGIASRRKAEELIQSGLVSVNGKTITEMGTKADPDSDSIRVNNKLLKGPEQHEYLALNKPRGYVTTVSDPEGRPTVMELVRSRARLYPIGRLDFNSEGLLLLTNDGDLAHKLMKAASHIPKTYLVKVAGQPEEEELRRLRAGVTIAEERDPKRRVRTTPAQIRVIKEADNPWLEVTLHEGRNRQIRKMFEEIGHHVEKIRRVRYGPLELDLPPGESRPLTPQEISRLKRATDSSLQPSFRNERQRPFEDRQIDGPRRPFKTREPDQGTSEESRTRERPARPADRQRTEFRARRDQRSSQFRQDRAVDRQRRDERRPKVSDKRPKWDERSRPPFRDRERRERAEGGRDFYSRPRRPGSSNKQSRERAPQNRERGRGFGESPRRSDHRLEEEQLRGDRRDARTRRGNRDRSS
ncbi:MAG TPA: pseudouridine synthase [Terriglobales bacterium]|nr:pseudouridine synthase [Terriglobales bacterium]